MSKSDLEGGATADARVVPDHETEEARASSVVRGFADLVREGVVRRRSDPAERDAASEALETARRQDAAEILRLETMLRSLQRRVLRLEMSQSLDGTEVAAEPLSGTASDGPPALAAAPAAAVAPVEPVAPRETLHPPAPRRVSLGEAFAGPRRLWPETLDEASDASVEVAPFPADLPPVAATARALPDPAARRRRPRDDTPPAPAHAAHRRRSGFH